MEEQAMKRDQTVDRIKLAFQGAPDEAEVRKRIKDAFPLSRVSYVEKLGSGAWKVRLWPAFPHGNEIEVQA